MRIYRQDACAEPCIAGTAVLQVFLMLMLAFPPRLACSLQGHAFAFSWSLQAPRAGFHDTTDRLAGAAAASRWTVISALQTSSELDWRAHVLGPRRPCADAYVWI